MRSSLLLTLALGISSFAMAQAPQAFLMQKITDQGVPTAAVARLFQFIADHQNHDFVQDTYVCLGNNFGSLKTCDENKRIRDQQTVHLATNPPYAAIVDFSLPSTERRFFLINMNTGEVKKFYSAHGKGSGEKYAYKFSNIKDSKQTSLGIYLAGDLFTGFSGEMMRLYGLEKSNDQAYNRDIVVHGAWYVGEDFINSINDQTKKKYDRLGVSWGCPALSEGVAPQVMALLKNGGLILHYHKDLMEKSQSGLEVSVSNPALGEAPLTTAASHATTGPIAAPLASADAVKPPVKSAFIAPKDIPLPPRRPSRLTSH